MKPFIKASSLGLIILSASMFTTAAQAAEQKIGYVATGPVLAQMAQQSNVNEKLRKEFKDRIANVQSLEIKIKKGIEKIKRDGELMTEKERTQLQRELQASDSELKLKMANLREDERKRSLEEQKKLIEKLQKTVESLAKKEGYDMVLDRQAVLFASPKDDLSDKVLKALK